MKREIVCSELSRNVILYLDLSGKGLPDGTNFEGYFSNLLVGTPSNASPLFVTLQYTTLRSQLPLFFGIHIPVI